MAQRKIPSDKPEKKTGKTPLKAGKPISLDESIKRIHKRHGKLLKKLAE